MCSEHPKDARSIEQQETAKLIAFFENKGYENLQEVGDSVNYIFHGLKDGQPVFIKRFNRPIVANANSNFRRANTEIACYQNLPKEILIDFIEASVNDHYIVLKKVELEDIKKDEQAISELVDFDLNVISNIDASFLPEWSWQDYEKKVFQRLEDLQAAGATFDAQKVKQRFIDNKSLIENSRKVFSHLDFNFLNVKKHNDKIVLFDFENAHRDNAMVDMAVLYVEICDNPKLKNKFQEIIQTHELYNEELLKLMVIRRCAIVLHAGLWANNDLSLENPFRRKTMMN